MTRPDTLSASLVLSRGRALHVGSERVRLLEAISETGSITRAAKRLGLSFRAAWNAVQAMNNLFAEPVVLSQSGGREGGGAVLTPAGETLLRGFKGVERELAVLVERVEARLSAEDGLGGAALWRLGLRTSARNSLSGVVEEVSDGAVNAEVVLRISPKVAVTAIITRESVAELGLKVGREATALIKSSFVILAPAGEALRTSARNAFSGVVVGHETGSVNDEVTLELDAGKTLTAVITRASADELGVAPGARLQALVKASHVILAVAD